MTTPKHNLQELVELIEKWAYERNIYSKTDGSSVATQTLKLMSEVGELADNVAKGRDISDDVGDCFVVLVNIARLAGVTIEDCVAVAYNDIKDRKGTMVKGVFIKEGDIAK